VPQTYAAPQYQPSAYGGPLGLSAAAAAPAPASAYQQYASPMSLERPRKSRTTYIVLGIFLGALGIHNFYAGYVGRAVGQLCLTVLTLGYLGVISWIWAIIEICIVEKDSTGLNFS
jgi:TM2 domain-containing membrane protein YozV